MRKIGIILLIPVMIFLLMACTKKPQKKEEIDMNKFPFYIEAYEDHEYDFNEDNTKNPFWKGNIIYNETVLLVQNDQETIGKLLFPALKVISVRDFSLKKEFKEDVDFKVEGNSIKMLEGSDIPYLTKRNIEGLDIPEPYRKVNSISNILTDYMMMGAHVIYTESPFWYGNQVSVTYAYDITKIDLSKYPTQNVSKMPNFMRKLENKETVRITAIGDSVLEGLSSSESFNREPFMPNFIKLTAEALRKEYQTEVILNNLSVGGTTSLWGANPDTVSKINQSNPDIVFIHFGINDNGSMISPNMYRDNIEFMILSVREHNPQAEIILLNAFSPNSNAYDMSRFDEYFDRTSKLEKAYDYVTVIDLYTLSKHILETKKFEDVTGNGINHVNDYSARIYLMAILATLIK